MPYAGFQTSCSIFSERCPFHAKLAFYRIQTLWAVTLRYNLTCFQSSTHRAVVQPMGNFGITALEGQNGQKVQQKKPAIIALLSSSTLQSHWMDSGHRDCHTLGYLS